nr:uncharacterized protein LOC117686425 [Crassostrea gigas]
MVQDKKKLICIICFQRLINNTIEKYSLKNARDSHLSAAVKEVKNYICASTTVGGVDDKKIAERMKRTLQWKRYYSRKRTHAAEKGIGIRDLFKRRKSLGDEKENLLPKISRSKSKIMFFSNLS